MTNQYVVVANDTIFGTYEADDEQGARDACAQDAGYKSEADMEKQLKQPSELVATPTTTITTIKLEWKTVSTPDLSGLIFFVKEGDTFDLDAYAEAYGINRSDMDEQQVKSVQDACGRLNPGECLQVEHTIESID